MSSPLYLIETADHGERLEVTDDLQHDLPTWEALSGFKIRIVLLERAKVLTAEEIAEIVKK